MGLDCSFTITVSQNGTTKKDLALSPQMLSLIPCCSLPPIILCIQDGMGNQTGVLIQVKTNLSFSRGKLTWTLSVYKP